MIFSFGADKQKGSYHDDGINIVRRENRHRKQQ